MEKGIGPIVERLRRTRERLGLTQRDLAQRSGTGQAQISRIESGAADPQISTLMEIARALGMEIVAVPQALVGTMAAFEPQTVKAGQLERRARDHLLAAARRLVDAGIVKKDGGLVDAIAEVRLRLERVPMTNEAGSALRSLRRSMWRVISEVERSETKHSDEDILKWRSQVYENVRRLNRALKISDFEEEDQPAYRLDDENV